MNSLLPQVKKGKRSSRVSLVESKGRYRNQQKVTSLSPSLQVSSVRFGRSQRKKRGGGRRRQKNGGSLRSKTTTLTPANRTVRLRYVLMVQLPTAVGGVGRAYPLWTNGAFAVDQSAPSGFTTTPGFSVLATNYAAYRVRKYRSKVTFSSLTVASIAVDTCVCHTNSLLGTSAGGTNSINIVQFAANRPEINTVKQLMPGTTSQPSKCVHVSSHTISSIAGESIMQPGYKSLTNTIPSIPTYIVFGWQAPSTVASGTCSVEVELDMWVEFLDYIDTLTSFTTPDGSPMSESERLSKLGTPAEIQPCAGCKFVKSLEFAPCPDPACTIVDGCTNCGFKRRCSANCQSVRCPYRADTIQLSPPLLTRISSKSQLCV